MFKNVYVKVSWSFNWAMTRERKCKEIENVFKKTHLYVNEV